MVYPATGGPTGMRKAQGDETIAGRDEGQVLSNGEGFLEATPHPRPRLLDQMREALRCRHYSRRTEQAYGHWIRRFIFFHRVRHPAEMGEAEIRRRRRG